MSASIHVGLPLIATLVLAAADRPGRPGDPPDPVGETWVEATSLSNDEPARVAVYPARPPAIPVGDGPWMVCAGARERATVCERVTGPSSINLTPAVGVPVTALIVVGQAPARGEVELLLDGLSARRPFTVPLARPTNEAPNRGVSTQADGHIAIPALAPGRYRLQLSSPDGSVRVSEPFTVPAPRRPQPGTASPQPSLDLGEIAFDEGEPVRVVALEHDGEPLAHVNVAGLQPASEDAPPIFASAQTSPGGRAELHGYDRNRPLGLTFRKDGYADQRTQYDAPPVSVEVRLERLARLTGSVVDEAGNGVEGALVSLRDPRRSVTSESHGSFSFAGLPAADYRLVATSADSTSSEVAVSVEAGEQAEASPLVLLASHGLEGVVRDAETHRAVAGATLRSLWPPAMDVTTDGEGRFSLKAGSADAPPLTVEVVARGYPPTTVRVEAPLADGAVLTIDLRKGGRIRAEAWDEEADQPCGGCTFTIQGPEGAGVLLTADASGVAESRWLVPGHYRVVLEEVRATGAVVEVRGGDNARDVEVASGAVSTVRFGQRKSVLHVRFTGVIPPDWRLVTRDAGAENVWPLQPDGSFRVMRASVASELVVYLSNSLDAQVLQGIVPPGYEHPSIEMDPPDTSVWGLLTEADGRPRGGVSIVLRQPSGAVAAWVQTRPDGRLEVSHLRPGRLSIVDGTTLLGSFLLAAGEHKDLGVLAPERP